MQGDALNAGIVLYALTVHYRKLGDEIRASELYKKFTALDEYWAGLVYIAGYAEKLL